MRKTTSKAIAPLTHAELDDPHAFALSALYLNAKPNSASTVHLPNTVLNTLSHVVSQVPGFAANVIAGKGQYYEVRFAPEIVKGLKDGTYHLVEAVKGGVRATAASTSGAFVGNGTLISPTKLKAVALGAGLWQIATVAVGQKHLSDITAKLDKISKDVRSLIEIHHDHRVGKLRGSLDYLEQIAGYILSGEISHEDVLLFRAKLEDFEVETLQTLSMIEENLDRTIENMNGVKRGLFTSGTDEIVANIHQYRQLLSEWYLAMRVRAAVAQLTAALPGGEHHAKDRIGNIHERLARRSKASIIVMNKYVVQTKLKGNYRNFFIRSQEGDGIHLPPVQQALSQLGDSFEGGKSYGIELKKSLQNVLGLLEMKGLRDHEPLRLAVEVGANGDVVAVGRMVG